MCCTFNMHDADTIFLESQYRDNIMRLQARDANMSFASSDLPGWYLDEGEPT